MNNKEIQMYLCKLADNNIFNIPLKLWLYFCRDSFTYKTLGKLICLPVCANALFDLFIWIPILVKVKYVGVSSMSFSDSQQHSNYIWLPINLSEKKESENGPVLLKCQRSHL